MKTGLKILISVVVFYYFLVNVLRFADFNSIAREIKSVNLSLLVNFFILSLTNALISATRTVVMLDYLGFKPSFLTSYFVTLTRNLFADLLPAKLGTLVYVWLIKRFLDVDYRSAVSAFAHVTVLDVIAVGFLVLIVGGLAGLVADQALGLWLFLIAVAIVVVGVLCVNYAPKILLKPLRSRSSALAAFIRDTLSAFVSLNEKGIFGKLLLLAVIQRFVKYFSYWILFLALVDLYGIDQSSAPFLRVVFAFITAEMFVSLPMFTVAGVGAFQTGWNLAFNILGFSQEIAVSTSFSHHVITQLWALVLGSTSIAVLFLFSGIFRGRFLFVPIKTVCTLAACLIIVNILALKLEGQALNVTVTNSLRSVCSKCELYFDGIVENQTTGIYVLRDKTVEKVIDDPKKFEQFPFYDFRNNRVIYTETESLRRDAQGRIKAVSGPEITVLVERGLFASVVSDNRVIFERDRARIFQLKDGSESLIFPKDGSRYELSKVRVSPNGRLIAFAVDRPSRWHVWVYDMETNNVISRFKGCEPWFDSDKSVVYIKIEGEKRTIRRYNFVNETETVLVEPFDEYVTFYFPSVKNNILLFSASRQHDANLERGQFDLFALKLDSKDAKPIKLISSNSLIRWPFLKLEEDH